MATARDAGPESPSPPPAVEDFLAEPTRELTDWHWLWTGDVPFPIRSHRGGLLARLLVAFKRLLRPLVKVPQNDLWERQRVFNLILLEHLIERDREGQRRHADHERRLSHLEAFMAEGLAEVMRHNDALFFRVDHRLDRYRREARDLASTLGAALAVVETADAGPLVRARDEHAYLELERRYRGTEEEIGARVRRYLPYLEGRGPVLDLGCGRGEALAAFGEAGLEARGVDGNAEMVARCRERGLAAEVGDLADHLAQVAAEGLGAVVSFHVIEHLPAESLDRLVRLAWRALRPGGVLILETPNPLSVVVAARNFWRDPTHRRPIHPDSLRLVYELAGFDPVELLPLAPFAAEERLPEIDLSALPADLHQLADRVNRLRDRLDEVLFGHQDYALIGVKPGAE